MGVFEAARILEPISQKAVETDMSRPDQANRKERLLLSPVGDRTNQRPLPFSRRGSDFFPKGKGQGQRSSDRTLYNLVSKSENNPRNPPRLLPGRENWLAADERPECPRITIVVSRLLRHTTLRVGRLGFRVLEYRDRGKSFAPGYHLFPYVSEPPNVCSLPGFPTTNDSALANQDTAMLVQVLNQRPPLHNTTNSSEKSFSAACRASCRLNSSASFRTSRNALRSSSLVFSCALTPGTSSIQPIHQSPLCLTMAVNVDLMRVNYARGKIRQAGFPIGFLASRQK